MIRIATLVVALLPACTDSLDPQQRAGAGDAVATAVASIRIYLALAQPNPLPSPGLVTGTREAFVIDGAEPSPWSGTSLLVGSGSVAGQELEMQFSVDLAEWHDGFWDTTLEGQLDVVETATYGNLADPLPTDAVTRVTGELGMTGELTGDGRHTFDLEICRRSNALVLGWNVYGLRGTVDGEPATDHQAGHDDACEPM